MDRVHAGIDQPFDVDDFARYLKMRKEQEDQERKQEAIRRAFKMREDGSGPLSPEERRRQEDREKLEKWMNKDHGEQLIKDRIGAMMENLRETSQDGVKETDEIDINDLEEVSLDEINTAREKTYSDILGIVKQESSEETCEEGPKSTTDVFNSLLQMQREQTDLMDMMRDMRAQNTTISEETEEDISDEDDEDDEEPSKNVTVAWGNTPNETVARKEKLIVPKENDHEPVDPIETLEAANKDAVVINHTGDPRVFNRLLQMQQEQNHLMKTMKELQENDLNQSMQEIRACQEAAQENEAEGEDKVEEKSQNKEKRKDDPPKPAEQPKKINAAEPVDKFPIDIADFKRFMERKRDEQGLRDVYDELQSDSEEEEDEEEEDFWGEKKEEKKRDIDDDEVNRALEEIQSKRDPVEFCEHIPGEIKRVKQRLTQQKAEEEMDEDDREKEYEAKRSQMEAIFELLQSQEDKFGVHSMADMENQMKLYVQ